MRGDAPRVAAAYRGDEPLWPAAKAALREHSGFIRRFLRDQPVQTNEVGRCWALLPAFLLAASRGFGVVDCIELGPSGGLNLCWDRYRYEYASRSWGEETSPVVLRGEWKGPFQEELVASGLRVRRRVGIDKAPVDVTTEEGALLLQAFLWADQPERLARMRAAIGVLRDDPPELIAGDYVEVLPGLLERIRGDALTIVFSSASTQYVDDAAFARLEGAIEAAGRRAPLAWVAMEPPRGTQYPFFLELREWPSGDARRLAAVHYHGAWVEWLSP